MKRYLIDANALISFVTDRNPRQQQKVSELLESAKNLKCVILCHQYILTEFIYVMDRIYRIPKDTISRMIYDLMEMPGIDIVQEIDFKETLSLWPRLIPDFGDAVIAAAGMRCKGCVVATFDRKLAARLKSLNLACYPSE